MTRNTTSEICPGARSSLPVLLPAVAFTVGLSMTPVARAEVGSVAELVAAINDGAPGDVVLVGPGIFELTGSLRPKAGMEIRGAGMGVTIVRNDGSWAPGNAGLDQDEGATKDAIDCSKYLFDLGSDNTDIVISDMTLTGPELHGGICGFVSSGLELERLEFKSFLWAGLRSFILDGTKIHDNVFFDAGGKSNIDSGSSGGALFMTYTTDAEIHDNRIGRSPGNDGYGVKGREMRDSRIHHNTIETDFAIELPFENDYTVDIDHNFLGGTISIPKYSGGSVPDGGYTFHVHHNYFTTSYSLEYQRNAVEIDHNLFDFSIEQDGGNLISSFDAVAAAGGTKMHDNLISNPGRGLYWNEGVYGDFAFYNNHVRGQTTVTPRTEGLFEFRPERDGVATDWGTIVVRDNIIELTGTLRPLMRNEEGHAAVVENNTLDGVSDARAYANPDTGQPRGPLEPLCFRLGAYEEWTLDGWTLVTTPDPVPPGACAVEGESSSGETGVSSDSSGETGETGETGDSSDSSVPTGGVESSGTTTMATATSGGSGPGGEVTDGTSSTDLGTDGAGQTPHEGSDGCSCVTGSDARGAFGWVGVLVLVSLGATASVRRGAPPLRP